MQSYTPINEIISFSKQEHEKLKKMVEFLNINDLNTLDVLSDWTIKEILAHIAAWNFEVVKGINDILSTGKTPQWGGVPEDEFNEIEIEKRKNLSLLEIIDEGEDSFNAVIERLENITEDEWENNKPIPIKGFFVYEYHGADHEGGHANQIEEVIKKLNL